MENPSLVVHVLLVGVNLVCKQLLDEIFHLSQCSELECLLLTLEEDLRGE